MINISLGSTDSQYRKRLQEPCRKAARSGSIIVAAASIRGLECYPAVFCETIAVGMDDRYSGYDYGYLPGRLAEFVAAGEPALLFDSATGAPLRTQIKAGTSFAAARMAANTAAIRELLPRASLEEVRTQLASRHKRMVRTRCQVPRHHPNTRAMIPHIDNQPVHGSVAVFPLDRDAEPMLFFSHLFPFRIASAVDPVHPSMASRDAGLLFGPAALGIPAVPRLCEVARDTGTVVLFDVTALAGASHPDVMRSTMQHCLDTGKNLFALGPQDPLDYPDLCTQAKAKGLTFQSAGGFARELLTAQPPHRVRDISIPVVLVLGTSFGQGKFKAQLSLKGSLSAEGYEVALVGTNPLCALMRRSFYVPQDPRSQYTQDLREQLPYWESVLGKAFESQPHLILVGGRGYTVPPRLYALGSAVEDPDPAGLPREYSLPAITTLLGAKPDAVILCVNVFDSEEYIRRTIGVIENLGQTRVIMLVLNEFTIFKNAYGYRQVLGRRLSPEEILPAKERLASAFAIPVFCPATPEQHREMAAELISSFAVDPPVDQEAASGTISA